MPNAEQQRCINHKVRGLKQYLEYEQLESANIKEKALDLQSAKRKRCTELLSAAYEIYEAETLHQAKERLEGLIDLLKG